jgi:hypothetical protein
LSLIDSQRVSQESWMSQSLRVSVCSNCGHLLTSAASCSGNTRRWTIQYSSRRSVSWRSIIDKVIPTSRNTDTATTTQTTPDENARKRAQEVVRRLRERKTIDQASNPPTIAQSPSEKDASQLPPRQSRPSSTSAQPSVKDKSQSPPRKPLRDIFGERSIAPRKSTLTRPSSSAKNDPSAQPQPKPKLKNPPRQRPIVTSKTRKPFLSPLHAEQMETMRKYLALSKEKGPTAVGTTPVPWDAAIDKFKSIRQYLQAKTPQTQRVLPKKISHNMPSPTANSGSDLISNHMNDFTALNASSRSSGLLRELRNHHDRRGITLEADSVIAERVAKAFLKLQESYRIYKMEDRRIEFERLEQFQTCMRDAFSMTSEMSPLGHYILGLEGFNPNELGVKIDLEMGDYDVFGSIKQDRLVEIASASSTIQTVLMQETLSIKFIRA